MTAVLSGRGRQEREGRHKDCSRTGVLGVVAGSRHLKDGSCSKRSDSDTYRLTSVQTSHLRLRRDVLVCLFNFIGYQHIVDDVDVPSAGIQVRLARSM